MINLNDVTVEGFNSAANELMGQAKQLAKRVYEAVEANNFTVAVILMSDMSIAASRADAALLALRAIEEEEITELDKESIERLLKRLQRDSQVAANKETRPSFVNTIQGFQFLLTSALERIESEVSKG